MAPDFFSENKGLYLACTVGLRFQEARSADSLLEVIIRHGVG